MEDKTNIGSIKIANEVIAIIASLSATEVDGVTGMSGGVGSGIAEMLGYKKGVKVEASESECVVDLTVIIDYGYAIPDVAEGIQENVKEAIESMTGLDVKEINIHVQGVHFANDDKEQESVEETSLN